MTDFLIFVSEQWLLVSGFLLLLYAFLFYESHKAGKQIGHHEVTQLLNSDQGVVIDVRESKDFKTGYVSGAINIPFAQLEAKKSELDSYKEKTLILTDKVGQHSGHAARNLKKLGFTTCRMRGGMSEWTGSNLPVVKD